MITNADLVPVVETSGSANDGNGSRTGSLYAAQVAAAEVPRVKVNEGASSAAMVSLFAWRGEKLLGKWDVGLVEGLGLEGLKSEEIHKRRVQQWESEGRRGHV